MGIRVERKVFKMGNARGITLPLAWVSYLGDDINRVTIIGSDLLVVVPPGLEKKAERLVAYMEQGIAPSENNEKEVEAHEH